MRKFQDVSSHPQSDFLIVSVSGDSWQGDPLFTVHVDGVRVGETYACTAQAAAGAVETVVIPGPFAAGPHRVEVTFINDAYGGEPGHDRNLFVHAVAFSRPSALATKGEGALYHNGSVTLITP